ncbi:TatD family hydrolase [bacterium]|nr:TatD family hydrolase [bacterium]
MDWIDTHAHLNSDHFEGPLDEVLSRAKEASVVRILVIGTNREDSECGVRLAQEYPQLAAIVGIQPNNLNEAMPTDFDQVVTLADHPTVVAIGETGMDRYWKTVPIPLQRDFFWRHLKLAHLRDLPVVIHCREAEADIVEVLTEFSEKTGKPIAGVMHSYAGDEATARACLALGLHISFAGMLTFKKNQALRDVAATVPLDRLLVETDTPYLSPEPFRGKPNEPARVIHTGACLAQIHGRSIEEMAAITTDNARTLFKL